VISSEEEETWMKKEATLILLVVLCFSLFVMPVKAVHNTLNCTWLGDYVDQTYNELANPQSVVNRLSGSNINCVIVFGGDWASSGAISYDSGSVYWSNFINILHKNGYLVFVWISIWDDPTTIDITNHTVIQTMYNSAIQCLSTYRFDGFNDDFEGWRGSTQALINYEQGLATAVRNHGKIASACLEVDWGGATISQLYPYLTSFNYLMPMYYTSIAVDNGSVWSQILSYAGAPIVMGLDFSSGDYTQNGLSYPSASQQLSTISNFMSENSTAKLVGFSIWSYDEISNTNFSSWDNWALKNLSATPSPSPSPIPTDSPIPTTAPSLTPTPLATSVLATTDNGTTVDIAISGNVTSSQMSNVTIATSQSAKTTTLSFTVTGESGTSSFGNITIPISAVPYGTTPTIYIDGQPVSSQGYTQDSNNYYAWYITQFSTHQISIVFTVKSSIPEFPTWIVLPLFGPVILLSIVFFRKRMPKK